MTLIRTVRWTACAASLASAGLIAPQLALADEPMTTARAAPGAAVSTHHSDIRSPALRLQLSSAAPDFAFSDPSPALVPGSARERLQPQTVAAPLRPQAARRADSVTRRLAGDGDRATIARAADPLSGLDAAEGRRITYAFDISAPRAATGLPVDVTLTPRATIERTRLGDTLRRGAEVRLGLDLTPDPRDPARRSMYLFAGAENQVLTYDLANGPRPALSDMKLEDKLTVGDMQAGVAMELHGIQSSVSLLSREVSAENASARENYAALTVTFRH